MPPLNSEAEFTAILTVLVRHKVEFVVVGGMAAILQGVPLATLGVAIVHSRESDNVTRLLGAMEELGAVYRYPAERKLAPNASHLSSAGHNLLMTKFGPLDVPGTIGNAHAWSEPAAQCCRYCVKRWVPG